MNAAKNVQSGGKTDRSDALLRKRVEAAIERDRYPGLNGLEVVGVDHGVVHMKATGVTMTGRLRAVQLAWDAAEEALSDSEPPLPTPTGSSTSGTRGENHDLASQTRDRARNQQRGDR